MRYAVRACTSAAWIFVTVKTGLKDLARVVRKRGVRQMTFLAHFTEECAANTHRREQEEHENDRSLEGVERERTPKRGLSYCVVPITPRDPGRHLPKATPVH